MAILRCTKKLLSELKAKPEDILRDFTELGCWHANLLRIDRRKCVLFTHDRTLYSFLVPGLTKPHFQNFNEVFVQNLFQNLLAEAFPQSQIELFLNDIREIHITKTNSRSVLGPMNDLSFQLKYRIYAESGLPNLNFMKLNQCCPVREVKRIGLRLTFCYNGFAYNSSITNGESGHGTP